MQVTVITIFPELFASFLATSLIQKAIEKQLLAVDLINPRDFASAPHFRVDDTPFGGGAGMVMKPEPLALAIEAAKKQLPTAPVILLSPAGSVFQQAKAVEFSRLSQLILVCGRYEGIDQRVIEILVDQQISIGDYILMGGEIPAMVLIESCIRLVPGVIGNQDSVQKESFGSPEKLEPLLEAPQYTRPATFRGLEVPDVLLSGNHKSIENWRAEQANNLTQKNRPDLLKNKPV